MKSDLSHELETVRALISKNGQPVLTEDVLRDAANRPTFDVGDMVVVLNACRLPKVEQSIGTGAIDRITYQSSDGEPLYWISGFPMARSARVLRALGKCPRCGYHAFDGVECFDCGYRA